jgi:diguanylate cyclase (GGDEF)-like protein
VQEEPDYVAWVDGIRSELCVPLRIGRRVIGVINAESMRLDAFSPADERLLVTLAGQLTTGIERVRLYRAALRAAERRAVLFQASQEIGASLEPEEIYKAIHRAARKLMPSDVFVIARVDSNSPMIQAPYLFEKDQRFPARQIPMDRGLSGYVITTGESLMTGDYDETHAQVVDAEVFGDERDETTSVLAVPMRLGNEVIGMLSTQAFRRDAFTEEDQEALESMAIQAAIALNNADLYVASRRQVMELRVLNEVSDALAGATSEDALIDEVTRLIGDALYPDNFGILLVDAKKGVLRVHPSYRGLLDQIKGSTLEFEVPLGQGVSGQVALRGEPWRISDVAQEPTYLEVDARMRSELCVPIKVGERVVGVINAESARPDAFTLADEQLLLTFAGQLATALEKMRLFQEVQHLAITDPLTGQFNRRHFFDEAEREFQRARRYARPLSVVMLDLDRFKRVNDSYGHAVGDRVLQVVAETCRRQLRTIDLLARYGGEEFIALLPESSAEDARHVAERLCRAIAALRVESDAGPVQVTISVGAAGLAASCADLDELLIRADRALYDAKEAGRNRVSVYSG